MESDGLETHQQSWCDYRSLCHISIECLATSVPGLADLSLQHLSAAHCISRTTKSACMPGCRVPVQESAKEAKAVPDVAAQTVVATDKANSEFNISELVGSRADRRVVAL